MHLTNKFKAVAFYMNDKDLDHIFSSNLKKAEFEPAEKVWKGIVLELDEKKSKNRLLPFLFIIAIMFGVWLIIYSLS